MSRETRLLLATIAVSALVLIVLSQFRFPERQATVPPPAPPLERLAARATYDELSGIVAAIAPQLVPSLIVLQLEPPTWNEPRRLASVLVPPPPNAGVSHVPGLRVGETTALAAVGADASFLGIYGYTDAPSPQLVVADLVRRLALVRVPPNPTGVSQNTTLGELPTPTYAIVVEGTGGGLSFRPLFIGASDRLFDPRWESPLVPLGSRTLTSPGALIFSLEGQFLGLIVSTEDTLAIAEAREVITTADRLSALGSQEPFDAGIAVQPLTRRLASALGVDRGVLIASVDPLGPAAELLQPADVVTMLDGRVIGSPDELLLALGRLGAGSKGTLVVIRDGETLSLGLSRIDAAPSAPAPLAGLELESRRGIGTVVVSVDPGSVSTEVGLRPDDVILRAGKAVRPTPAEFRTLVQELPPGAYLALTITRGGRQRILAFGATAAAETDGVQ